MDIVKAFFRKGMYCTLKIIERNNRPHIIAFGVDGLRFGEIKYDSSYVEWKTFVNKEMAYRKQDELEQKLTNELLHELEKTKKMETCDLDTLRRLKNRVFALPLPSRNTG